MGGQSKQEEQAEQFYNEAKNINPNVKNRFDDNIGTINDIFSKYGDIINRNASNTIADSQRDASSRLASRGITGGSILNDTFNSIGNNVNRNKFNALGRLGVGRGEAQLKNTELAQNVDLANIANLFKKLGVQGSAIQGLDDDTWLDDVFAGLNAGGSVAMGVGALIDAI